MLSEQSAPVIRATLPVVGAAIDDIAGRFYEKLFRAHPELLRNLFNRGNQGTGDQKKALAGSIAAFAGMLVAQPDARPDAMLERIANKHASLGITPDQYKIVHRHLFAAIVEILDDAVTPEVASAWDEVYWLMANALIAVEARLYQRAGVADGEVWRQMRVVGRVDEAVDVISLEITPADDRPAGSFLPGQYVSVQADVADGARQIRQYSLSWAPDRPHWRITVKKIHDGKSTQGEVSTRLHDTVVGDELRVSLPFGDLVVPPDDRRPLVLASAGIGVTPMIGILDHLGRNGSTRQVTVIHADRSPSCHAHRDEQRRLIDAIPEAVSQLWYEDTEDSSMGLRGRVDLDRVSLSADSVVLMCGPLPFMRKVRGDLIQRGIAARDIHYEVFGPDMWLADD